MIDGGGQRHSRAGTLEVFCTSQSPAHSHASHLLIVSAVPRVQAAPASVQGRLRRGLVLWVKGAILAHNGCQDATAVALEMHGRYETLHRELREWTYDDADRIVSWGPGTEVDAAACFPERLRWVLDLWVALVVGVAYREHALPVAWHVVKADAPASWVGHFRRRRRAPAVPTGMPGHVLCDRGLDSRKLWARITEPGWHPVLHYAAHITFRPPGGDRVPGRTLGGGQGFRGLTRGGWP